MQVNVLGPTVVTEGEVRLTGADLGGGKPRQLLEMLALSLGNPMSKDLLAEQLWDGRPPSSYIATVESYVCGLRRRIGLPGGRRGPLATTPRGYLLDPDQVRVDVWEVRRLLEGDGGDVARGLDLLPGELLADEPYASWANEARGTFSELVTTTCTRAAREANRRGDAALAVRLAGEATRRSYFSEPAVRELMHGLVHTGERVMALRAYETLRVRLHDELGVEPEAATQQRYLMILRGDDADRGHSQAKDEMVALLQLLRRALEDDGNRVFGLPAMYEVGQLLLARAR